MSNKSARDTGRKEKTHGAPKQRRGFGGVLSAILNVILTIILIGVITGIIVVGAFAIYVQNYIDPVVDEALFEFAGSDSTTRIYYMDYTDRTNRVGTPVEIEDQRLYGSQNSLWAQYDDIPQDLKDAFVAIEDKRFWDHHGVDWYRTGGAVMNFFLSFESSFGGSTITQQLIKNVTQYKDATIQRKVQEILCAINLEKTKSKEEILELYLNIVPLSQGCYGVRTAAYTYFGKDVKDLTLIECAAVASITNAPTRYDPIQNPENNTKRRREVLDKMLEQEKISQEEYDAAYNAELVLNVQRSTDEISTNSWYTDTVIKDVINDLVEQKGYTEQLASQLIYSGGLDIITNMDPEVQSVLEEVYENDANFPNDKSGIKAESAMVIADPYTGDLLGIVGSRGEKTGNRILNYGDQTTRPPGSSLKPLSVYAPAIEEKLITYGTVFDDVPVDFGTNPEYPDPWPANLPAVYGGLTTVNSAIERSVNTIAVRILQKIGLRTSFDYLTQKLGFDYLVESATYESGARYTDIGLAALALGQLNYGITVRDMATAYCVFPNDGIYNESKSYLYVYDSDGNILLNNDSAGNIVFSEQTAFIMTKMMQNVVNNGTARSVTLRSKIETAGKTGTSSNDYDRWFVGFTPYYVGAVWYGFSMPKSLASLAQNPCNAVWDTVMTKLHQKYLDAAASGEDTLRTFDSPGGIKQVTYCKDSGKLMTAACALDPRGNRAETGYFTLDTAPTEYCDCHTIVTYDKVTGGVAHSGCPVGNLTEVALIKVTDRNFPVQVTVTDAQYVYRDLPAGTAPGNYWGVPFFINTIPSGRFCGISNVNGGRQYNCYCYEHYHGGVADPDPQNNEPED